MNEDGVDQGVNRVLPTLHMPFLRIALPSTLDSQACPAPIQEYFSILVNVVLLFTLRLVFEVFEIDRLCSFNL